MLPFNDCRQNCSSEEPTKQDIYNALNAMQQKNPANFRLLISKLYQKLVQPHLNQGQDKDSSICPSFTCQSSARQKSITSNFRDKSSKHQNTSISSQRVNSKKEDSPLPSISSDSQQAPALPQQAVKGVIQIFRPTPTKYEVQQQFLRMKQKKQLNISGEVYDRFGRFQEKSESRVGMKKIKSESQQNIQRAQLWDRNSNKQYRIYASKVAPRFHSRNQEMGYYQKRRAAKTFSERGYRIDREKQIYSQKFAPANAEGKKNKTVSIGFVLDTYRRFEHFLMQDMRKSVRPLNGLEQRYLYSVILTANQRFTTKQYDCFRKFAKAAFDLGSVSIYEQDAISLFLAIQTALREKVQSGEKIDDENFCPLPVKNIPLLDIYAPKPGGGYQEEIQIDSQSLSLDIDDEQLDEHALQFIENTFDL